MDHFEKIYRSRAAEYHHMITPEDTDGNLLPAIEQVARIEGQRVLDLGSGTGRLPLLFGRKPAQMIALDLHADMLREHRRQRAGNWDLVQADMRRLPLLSKSFDVVIAGWSIGHFVAWYGNRWPGEIGRVLQEMQRVVAPGGALVIIETLGTGSITPAPPTEGLAQYYSWLENGWGFSRQEIQTDLQFTSVEEAVNSTSFFFGDELAAKIRKNGWARLPEWTGVWSAHV